MKVFPSAKCYQVILNLNSLTALASNKHTSNLNHSQCDSVFETCAESLHVQKYGEKFGYCQEVNLFDQWWLLLITCFSEYLCNSLTKFRLF